MISVTWNRTWRYANFSETQVAIIFVKNYRALTSRWQEAFALTFDGRKAVIGQDEFEVDEALIAEVTELPRTGEN
jgi:hypothetical protein